MPDSAAMSLKRNEKREKNNARGAGPPRIRDPHALLEGITDERTAGATWASECDREFLEKLQRWRKRRCHLDVVFKANERLFFLVFLAKNSGRTVNDHFSRQAARSGARVSRW